MKRIRNPDTGRFHTPEEAFEALASVGAVAHCGSEEFTYSRYKQPVCVVELGIDGDHPGFKQAMGIFRAAIPHDDEASIRKGTFTHRPGFDYYVPAGDPKVAALEKLMAPLRALLA